MTSSGRLSRPSLGTAAFIGRAERLRGPRSGDPRDAMPAWTHGTRRFGETSRQTLTRWTAIATAAWWSR